MPAKKAATVKLSGVQWELLKKVHGAGEGGYQVARTIEERSLKALHARGLVKPVARDKATGKTPYRISVAGRKHVESLDDGGSSPSA